ncbi:MAG: periplasmic heavy metal sensor [Parvularculaceae bacterium]
MGRGLVIALALSLAGNVFLGGFVAGRIGGPAMPGFERGRDNHGHERQGGDNKGRSAELETLPPAVREKLRAAFKSNRADFIASVREGRILHEQFISTLTADEFDRASAEAAAQKIETFEGERRRTMPRLIIEVMDGLSAEDRRALAAVVERRIMDDFAGPRPPRRGFRGRWRERDGEPPAPAENTESPPAE